MAKVRVSVQVTVSVDGVPAESLTGAVATALQHDALADLVSRVLDRRRLIPSGTACLLGTHLNVEA